MVENEYPGASPINVLIRSYGTGRCPLAQQCDKNWATLAL